MHLFRVLLLFDAQFFLVDSLEILLLFFRMLIYLLFLKGQFSSCFFELHFLFFDQVLKASDLLIVLVHCILKLHLTSFILKINICLQCLDALLYRVQSDFLDKDLF